MSLILFKAAIISVVSEKILRLKSNSPVQHTSASVPSHSQKDSLSAFFFTKCFRKILNYQVTHIILIIQS